MDNEQFGRLYRNQFDCVYRYALAITGNPAHAEDIAQEAFAKFIAQESKAAEILRPEAWLMRVARNLAIETIRNRTKNNGNLKASSPATPEQALYRGEVLERVFSALSQLAPIQRESIALREFGGLSYQEIAEITNTTIEQVKVQIFRARQKLRRDLEDLV
jgi:RNA polymerase sigma factor (sigma-70 family)